MTNSVSTFSSAYVHQVQAAQAQQPQPASKVFQQQEDSVHLSAQAKAAVAGSKGVDRDNDGH